MNYVSKLLLCAFASLLPVIPSVASSRRSYPLNDDWRFFFRTENSSDQARYVSLPHTWDTGTDNYTRSEAIYQKSLFIPAEWAAQRIFLRFGAVETVAGVFVNGCFAGEHRGGRSAFAVELTGKLRFGADNTIQVMVSNAFQNDVLPTSTDCNLYGGIPRGVELLITPSTAISPLYYGSEGVLVRCTSVSPQRAEGSAEVHLISRGAQNGLLRLRIESSDGEVVARREQKVKFDGKPATVPFTVENPRLWSPDDPTLYTVVVELVEAECTDRVRVRMGFRSIEAAPDGLLLNGERIAVRGVSVAYDRPGRGDAWTPEEYGEEFALLREVGANALCSTTGAHGDELYDLCDEQGMLARIDLPFMRAPFLSDIAYYPTARFEENGRQQLREIIAQHINRPSVIMWGLFTNLRQRGDDMEPYLRELQQIARSMDATRPTVACSNQDGSINFVTDLIVWRQEAGWDRGQCEDLPLWSSLLRKNWGHLHSAVCYGAPGSATQQPDNLQRQSLRRLPERRQTQFHEEYARHLMQDSLFWGIWIEQLSDYASARQPYAENLCGMVDYARRTRKDIFWLYKALWNRDEPTLYIAERRWRMRGDSTQQIKVYSSAGEPSLRINGDTVGMKLYAPCQYRTDTLVLSGPVHAVVEAGALRDSIEFTAGCALKGLRTQDLRRKADL